MMFYLEEDVSGWPDYVSEEQKDFIRLLFLLNVYYMCKYVIPEIPIFKSFLADRNED